MTRPLLIAAILALTGAILWVVFFWHPDGAAASHGRGRHQSLELASRPKGGDFELQSAKGPVRLADLRGKVVLLYFGYTACPDVCPTNLSFIAQALKGLSEGQLTRVQVLFVSVDPERDELDRLATYAAYFHPRILGITGSPEQVRAVADLYGAAYRRSQVSESAMGYLVDHSAYTYVVDPSGRLIRALDHATPPEEIRQALLALLPEAGAPPPR